MAPSTGAIPPAESEPIDVEATLRRLEGDQWLLVELAGLILQELPAMMESVRSAIAAADPPAVEGAAHKLKGSLGNFAARPAFEAALSLEMAGREARVADFPNAYTQLEREIGRFEAAMVKIHRREAQL